MHKYEHHNHAKYKIRYHVILSVKYHKRLLAPIIEDIKISIKRAEQMTKLWKIECVEANISNKKDHHLHLLIKAKPQVSPSEIIRLIKQTTTFDMWKKNYDYLRQFFWKKEHHLWTRGYFVSTIGDVSEKTLSEYIERQG